MTIEPGPRAEQRPWPRMARDREGDVWIETPRSGWLCLDDIDDDGDDGQVWPLETLTERYGPIELDERAEPTP
jgi:hypothetical protein